MIAINGFLYLALLLLALALYAILQTWQQAEQRAADQLRELHRQATGSPPGKARQLPGKTAGLDPVIRPANAGLRKPEHLPRLAQPEPADGTWLTFYPIADRLAVDVIDPRSGLADQQSPETTDLPVSLWLPRSSSTGQVARQESGHPDCA
jgi:hypothetical protein